MLVNVPTTFSAQVTRNHSPVSKNFDGIDLQLDLLRAVYIDQRTQQGWVVVRRAKRDRVDLFTIIKRGEWMGCAKVNADMDRIAG